jgi:bifunctional non-homologous end joining protein LigD
MPAGTGAGTEPLRPMLATLVAEPPSGRGWAFELKWDGIRALARVQAGSLRLTTRNGNDVTRRYPELAPLAPSVGRDAVLDGEIVAFDGRGRPSFELLQARMHVEDDRAIARLATEIPVTYLVFDLLELDGGSLLDLPYADRRARLAALALDGPHWRVPPYEEESCDTMLAVSREHDLEGIVAKRLDSRYEPGRRSRAWQKVKHTRRQEFVVGGWLPGEGNRAGTVGALLVGAYDGDQLVYAGRVGSGLGGHDLAVLDTSLRRLARDDSSFARGPVPKGARFAEPELVVEVRFREWTRAGVIRHPVFCGLRTDKEPRAVTFERAERSSGGL